MGAWPSPWAVSPAPCRSDQWLCIGRAEDAQPLVGAARGGAWRGVGKLPVGPHCPQSPLSRGAVRGKGGGVTLVMALLLEHEFKPLPADKQIETLPFLEAVAHLPPFFGETGVAGAGRCGLGPGLLRAQPLRVPPPQFWVRAPLPDPGFGCSARAAVVSRSCQTCRAAPLGSILRSPGAPRAGASPGQELPSHPWHSGGCRRGRPSWHSVPAALHNVSYCVLLGGSPGRAAHGAACLRTGSVRCRSGCSRMFCQGCVSDPARLEVTGGAAVGGRAVPRANSHIRSSEILF